MVSIERYKAWLAGAALTLVLSVGSFAVSTQAVAQDPAAPAADAPAAAGDASLFDAPAPAPAEEPKAEASEAEANPYGLMAMIKHSDFVARFVLLSMVIMSASTWYVMVAKFIEQKKLLGQRKEANEQFWKAGTVEKGIAALDKGTPFWYIADRGLNASQHHEGTMVEQIDLSTWVTMSVNRAVEEIQSRLASGMGLLATVGSVSPFVGLFGTVWGIMHALTAIGMSGQASIDKVAGPVGEALIMTAIGLAVAVPAVMAYNWLTGRNKRCMEGVRAFGSDLHSVLLSGARVGEKG